MVITKMNRLRVIAEEALEVIIDMFFLCLFY